MKKYNIFSLKNKIVLVTGATGYLGRHIALGLSKAGAKVLVNSRCSDGCRNLVNEIEGFGGIAEVAVFDVTNKSQVARYFSTMKGLPLHGIVNSAHAGGAGSTEIVTEQNFLDSYAINVVAPHNIFNAALSNLRIAVADGEFASVINIASMYGLVSPEIRIYDQPCQANPPYYGASKAALIQLTRYIACEFGAENIRCNSIAPGPFPSGDVKKDNPVLIGKLSRKVPLNRVGNPEEIIGPVIFLISNASSFVNGANLVVDGGWTSW